MQERDVIIKNIRLNRSDIAYIKHIFDGYDGIVTVTTVDRVKSVIQLCIIPDFISDVEMILQALGREIDMFDIDGGDKE